MGDHIKRAKLRQQNQNHKVQHQIQVVKYLFKLGLTLLFVPGVIFMMAGLIFGMTVLLKAVLWMVLAAVVISIIGFFILWILSFKL